MSLRETNSVLIHCGPGMVSEVLSILRRTLPSDFRVLSGRLSAAGAHLTLEISAHNFVARNAIAQIKTTGAEVELLEARPPGRMAVGSTVESR